MVLVDELTLEGVGRPHCPDPGHEQHRVVRDGFRGKAPARRQRFRCVNPTDRTDWHRLALPVQRVVAPLHRCEGCAQLVPPHAGPVVPGGYHYLASVVAGALVDVATGGTFQQASARARAALALNLGTPGGVVSSHGSLAADWTEVFAPVVAPAAPWPAVLLVDSTQFWRRQGGGKVGAFTVLAAWGYDLAPVPEDAEPDPWDTGGSPATPGKPVTTPGKLVRLRRSDGRQFQDWRAFFAEGTGAPQIVVADGASEIGAAARAVWPDVTVIRCTWHWTKNLIAATTSDLVRLTGRHRDHAAVAGHALLAEAEHALRSPEDLAAFAAHARDLVVGQPVFTPDAESLLLKWLATNETEATAQLTAAVTRPGPASTGPLEQLLKQRLRPTLARRAQGLVNPERTQRLLDLLTAGYRNEAHASAWTAVLRDHLAANERRPELHQRAITRHR